MQLTPQSSSIMQRTLGMPEEGPKCIPIPLDFSVATVYTLDYMNFQQLGRFSMLQTVYVDNSLNAAKLNITIPALNQVLKIPAGVQGYFPILCPNPIKLSFDSTGGVLCQVILLNFPILT